MEEEKKPTYPQGYMVNLWTACTLVICSVIAIIFCAASGQWALIGIGPAIGVPLGISIGKSIENRLHTEERIRSRTEKELRRLKIFIIAAVVCVTAGIILFMSIVL